VVAKTNEPGSLGLTVVRLKRQIEDQNQRIAKLARGREESMQRVNELRTELALVCAERDKLRTALTAADNAQIETIAFDDSELPAFAESAQVGAASIDDLMTSLSGEDTTTAAIAAHRVDDLGPRFGDSLGSADSGQYQEMISPDLIVLGPRRERGAGNQRYLVLIRDGSESRCPLDQELMTIGRSDSADIQIDGDFISRIHARVLRIGMDSVIEDAGSKNGTRVNGDSVRRHVLKCGDLVRVGSVSFRYIDTAASDDCE